MLVQIRQQSENKYLDSPSSSYVSACRSPLHPLNQQARVNLRRQPQYLAGQDERRTDLQGHLPSGRGCYAQRLRWGTEEVERNSLVKVEVNPPLWRASNMHLDCDSYSLTGSDLWESKNGFSATLHI